jgi:uncharacterized protein with FMN-binding domain
MRRIVFAILSTITTVVLLFSYHTSTKLADASTSQVSQAPAAAGAATPTASPSASASASATATSASTTFTGVSANAKWGAVQVRITVKSGKITASEAVQHPQENGKDVEINGYALPILNEEVVQAQSATIDTVSGATLTSDGYLLSLQSAIDQAHL